MTAPPRPEWLWEGDPSCVFGWDPAEQRAEGDEVRAYIEHLERRIEQLEATQREATWRPDRESDLD